MVEHNAWIAKGFDDGAFLMTGTLQPKQGGFVLAHNVTRTEVEQRISQDPFVIHDIVAAEIMEIAPGKSCPELDFLLA